MKDWLAKLFFLFVHSDEAQLWRYLEWKEAEIEMLRARVPQQRIFLTNEERERLLELGEGIGPAATKLITIVHPRTYHRWLERRRTDQKVTKRTGGPRAPESVRELVIRLARETGWGYGRIVGELRKLRIFCVGRTTVGTILKEEGVKPSPKRGRGTWDEFVKIHAETLW